MFFNVGLGIEVVDVELKDTGRQADFMLSRRSLCTPSDVDMGMR